MTRYSSSRIPSLDGLRALSIILVLIGHATNQPGLSRNIITARYSLFGVRVFFVLSGFLITLLLMQERERTGSISLRGFYLRRCWRILPPAIVFMTAISVTCWRLLSRTDLICAWSYTVDFLHPDRAADVIGHLWSLSVEEQFYLLWPLLLILFWRHRVRIAIVAICLAPICRIGLHAIGQTHLATISFPCVEDALATGCLLAMCRHKVNAHIIDRFIVPIVLLTIMLPAFKYPRGIEPLFIPTIVNVGIALIIDHCIRKEHAFLNWKPVVWLGLISYSLYLWQQPFLNTPLRHPWSAFPLNLMLAFACAICSYYAIERPSQKLRILLSPRSPARKKAGYTAA